ncbi:hypothetical protein Patl1_30110 [Pistacia atlantica]|uniref:Uncharacterized protein n=1 Tax=Pistacia atlantica TaxID=434234 RepID=A0ACC1A9Y4_9ROSI|nr:hypothetical protein Patl1_30110 [Pistacia atlantica]
MHEEGLLLRLVRKHMPQQLSVVEFEAHEIVLEKDAQCMLGLVLYSLDRLFHAVEGHAKATGEWQCLKQDIIDLAKPGLQTEYKLRVTSRMERMYDCLLPSLTGK